MRVEESEIEQEEGRGAVEIPDLDSPEIFLDRELSWLGFARRVLAQVEDPDLPLLERVKFAGIVGMLHDEFYMKRMGRLARLIRTGSTTESMDGRSRAETYRDCRREILQQARAVARLVRDVLRPALAAEGLPILDEPDWSPEQRSALRSYFERSVLPILTPLAVDAEHPFPFVSNDALNLAVTVPAEELDGERFVRVKVPNNRPRWIPLPEGGGFAPLEVVIAANLDLMFPTPPPTDIHLFRVTRAAEGGLDRNGDLGAEQVAASEPGSIVRQVSMELEARRFAEAVRLQVDAAMPSPMLELISDQIGIDLDAVDRTETFLGLSDLLGLEVPGREELRVPPHEPVTHPRLRHCPKGPPGAIFEEIRRGDVLLHHPYDSFDTSVLRFIESAAVDPRVLAIKLTIYRTSRDSPIVKALAEASRRGKQVAVLVEITARFDEAPNIAWGEALENEGVHVAYGVEKLKTHVKLALVVREEDGGIRQYAHFGTGNYHTGTARTYEDLGILTADPVVCQDTAAVFNQLTGATQPPSFETMLVAPTTMRDRFVELVRREAGHARAGRPAGIQAKMNQLQDPEIIRELYRASRDGVPIELNVRGLCCLRPGVPGLSETIEVFGIVSRFLEHSRVYRFENAGQPRYFIGSADWMVRNLSRRIETIVPVHDPVVQEELDEILRVYREDNCTAWDAGPDGSYVRRSPAPGEERRAAQEQFIRLARGRAEAAAKSSSIDPQGSLFSVDDL